MDVNDNIEKNRPDRKPELDPSQGRVDDRARQEQLRKMLERRTELPPIRVDDEVSQDEPHVSLGNRRASLGPPLLSNIDDLDL